MAVVQNRPTGQNAMAENHFRIAAVSAALMMGALVFGLYPETPAEKTLAERSVLVALDDYQGNGRATSDFGARISLAVRDHLSELATAAYHRLVGGGCPSCDHYGYNSSI